FFPTANTIVGDTVTVHAGVTTVYDLASVVLSAGGRQTPMPIDVINGGRTASLIIAGVPQGPLTLTVTATDVHGTVGTGTVTVIHDVKPTIAISQPAEFTVARPSTHVTVSCTDDSPSGCMSVSVGIRASSSVVTLASGRDRIDLDIS